ncbi:MAG: HPr family phosphocarrier protein [Pyrinomonadaceae bacterium]
MIKKQIIVVNRLGLHARAAAGLVRLAEGFQCDLRLKHCGGSTTADVKSILSLLMLAATCGDCLQLAADGMDEEAAVEAINSLFNSCFGEERVIQ